MHGERKAGERRPGPRQAEKAGLWHWASEHPWILVLLAFLLVFLITGPWLHLLVPRASSVKQLCSQAGGGSLQRLCRQIGHAAAVGGG